MAFSTAEVLNATFSPRGGGLRHELQVEGGRVRLAIFPSAALLLLPGLLQVVPSSVRTALAIGR